MKRFIFFTMSLLAVGSALAQGYPSKPIKFLVPFTAGSGTDLIARSIADTMSKSMGQPIVIENKPGAGGTIAALIAGKNDPGFAYNGPLAGLVAVCAGSDLMHPMGALVVGAVAGGIFVVMFTLTQNKWRIDDVLGVWPLHGLCGTWGGIAAGIFGTQALGGLGGINLTAQLAGTALGVTWALVGGFVVYGVLKMTLGLRLSQEEEFEGADLTIHKITASPDREASW